MLKPRTRSEKGQTLVEFALLLPLFLIVIFIIIDFGVGISRWVIVTNATREGARLGAVCTDAGSCGIEGRVADTSNGLLDPADVTVSYVGDGDGSVDRGESVIVESDYDYQLITPLSVFLDLTFDSLVFNSCTDMRVEQPVTGASDDGSEC